MLGCKICGKSLYINITFENMFKIDYNIHSECLNKLSFNEEAEVIPIESNTIIYDYVFNELKSDFNKEYLEFNYLIKVMLKHINNHEWSMMIIYDELVHNFIENHNPYLLINLSKYPLLFVSLEVEDISILEGL